MINIPQYLKSDDEYWYPPKPGARYYKDEVFVFTVGDKRSLYIITQNMCVDDYTYDPEFLVTPQDWLDRLVINQAARPITSVACNTPQPTFNYRHLNLEVVVEAVFVRLLQVQKTNLVVYPPNAPAWFIEALPEVVERCVDAGPTHFWVVHSIDKPLSMYTEQEFVESYSKQDEPTTPTLQEGLQALVNGELDRLQVQVGSDLRLAQVLVNDVLKNVTNHHRDLSQKVLDFGQNQIYIIPTDDYQASGVSPGQRAALCKVHQTLYLLKRTSSLRVLTVQA